jgi:hypothetical protein
MNLIWKNIISIFAILIFFNVAFAQIPKMQQGIIYKKNTSNGLSGILITNKRSLTIVESNIFGIFNVLALPGDTLTFKSVDYLESSMVVTDYIDKIEYFKPTLQLKEVVIKSNSIEKDLNEVQRIYRSKGVFYTGNPHYYYLFVKPMTFIYENFKSEVKDARKFKKYSKRELEHYYVSKRFNDSAIRSPVPIKDKELEKFKLQYFPTLTVLNKMSDYYLMLYIRKSLALKKRC